VEAVAVELAKKIKTPVNEKISTASTINLPNFSIRSAMESTNDFMVKGVYHVGTE